MGANSKHSGIPLKLFADNARGNLYVGEAERDIPFPIKRFYIISDIPSRDVVRGGHAHRKIEQVMFCAKGSCTVRMDDGTKKWEVALTTPKEGLYIGAGVWHDFTDCSRDCVVLMVASDYYDEADYIRDYPAFVEFLKEAR